jgi:chromosome segregation ATPase
MSVSEVDQSKLEVLRQHITELEAKNVKTKAEKADIEDMYIELLEAIREEYTRRDAEKAEYKARIEELEKIRTDTVAENAELRARVVKLEQDIDEHKKELESKKNRKFQEKCILIAQVLLGEEPVVEYRPSFMGD